MFGDEVMECECNNKGTVMVYDTREAYRTLWDYLRMHVSIAMVTSIS